MAPKGDWILLSTAVVRMTELSPTYRLRPGLAHRDLEYAIGADRVELHGHRIGASAGPPVAVPRPISPRHEVNLHHNTILLKSPGLQARSCYSEMLKSSGLELQNICAAL
jgi:hypothetical protein